MNATLDATEHVGDVHPALRAAFAALEAEECLWAIVRQPDDLAHPAGDIDILIAVQDRSRSRRAMSSAGYAPLPHDGASDLWLSYSEADDRWLWIDLATSLSFGDPPIHVNQEEAVLSRRERSAAHWVLAPEDRLWTLVLRAALDRGAASARYRERLHEAAAFWRRPSPARQYVEALMPSGADAEMLAIAAQKREWETFDSLLSGMTARRRGVIWRTRALTIRAGRRARSASSAPRHRGLSVALIGPDGVGKSTLAHGLAQSIPVPVRTVYMGVWFTPRIPAFFRGPGRVSYAAGVQWLRWLIGYYHRLRGRMVIFDRYSEENLAPVPRADPLGRLLQRIRGMVACPAPDLALLLETSGTVAFARKGEHSPGEIERIRDRFRGLVNHYPRVVTLDAERPAALVRADALRAIWSLYRRRLGR